MKNVANQQINIPLPSLADQFACYAAVSAFYRQTTTYRKSLKAKGKSRQGISTSLAQKQC
jgi:hypothetical protein